MKFTYTTVLAFVLAAAPAFAQAASPAKSGAVDSAKARVVTIAADELMKYNMTEIVAKRGERLRIVLRNSGPKGAMQHNLVVLALGTDATAMTNASAFARDDNYIAPAFAKKVLAAIPPVDPQQTAEITFTVPKVAGKYEYVCTLPGHYLGGMRGVLIVK